MQRNVNADFDHAQTTTRRRRIERLWVLNNSCTAVTERIVILEIWVVADLPTSLVVRSRVETEIGVIMRSTQFQ
jgi:hypothetical protein